MTQYLIIGAIVAWALLYSAWALMPAGVRRAVAAQVAACARRCGLAEPASQSLRAKLAQPSGCSACSTCTGCAKPAREASPRGHG